MALYFECYLETTKKREEAGRRTFLCFDFGLSDKRSDFKTTKEEKQGRPDSWRRLQKPWNHLQNVNSSFEPQRGKTQATDAAAPSPSTETNASSVERRSRPLGPHWSWRFVPPLSGLSMEMFSFSLFRPVVVIFSCFPRDLEHFCPFTQEIGRFYRHVG